MGKVKLKWVGYELLLPVLPIGSKVPLLVQVLYVLFSPAGSLDLRVGAACALFWRAFFFAGARVVCQRDETHQLADALTFSSSLRDL